MPASEPIVKDHGLVLRWYPVTDTSRVVIWFTRDHGRVATLIRGSQRPKSWVLGQYDLFYTCEVLYYARAREDLHPLRECAPLNFRSAFRRDWRACMGASFVADLLSRITPPMAAAPVLYRQAACALDLLCTHGFSPAVLFWFELQALTDLGVTPDLEAPDSADLYFDAAAGKITRVPPKSQSPSAAITPGALQCLRRLQNCEDPATLPRLRLSPAQVREIAAHLHRFTCWHLDLDLRSRRHAFLPPAA